MVSHSKLRSLDRPIIFIDEREHNRTRGISFEPEVEFAGASVRLGEASARSRDKRSYRARSPIDPQVSISLLQGAALFDHLVVEASRYEAESYGPPFTGFLRAAGAMGYFANEPLPSPTEQEPRSLEPGRPVDIEVGIPASAGLEAAFAVAVRDIDNSRTSMSATTFVTSIGDQVITTELPFQLLSELSQRILGDLGWAGSVDSLARRRERPRREIWAEAVAATVEMGAASVAEAVALAAGMPPDSVGSRQ